MKLRNLLMVCLLTITMMFAALPALADGNTENPSVTGNTENPSAPGNTENPSADGNTENPSFWVVVDGLLVLFIG